LRWYLVHTKPCRETIAQSNLLRQGYDVYFPRLLQTSRRNDRWQERVTALFPRYMFVCVAEDHQSLGPVRSTTGVATVVRFGLSCALVPESVITELRAREDPESGLHRLRLCTRTVAGAAVRVTIGPFAGLEGIFDRELGRDRVVALLTMLGQEVRVRMPAAFVESDAVRMHFNHVG